MFPFVDWQLTSPSVPPNPDVWGRSVGKGTSGKPFSCLRSQGVHQEFFPGTRKPGNPAIASPAPGSEKGLSGSVATGPDWDRWLPVGVATACTAGIPFPAVPPPFRP